MSSSQKKAKVIFNEGVRQWIGLESVQEKIDTLPDIVQRSLREEFVDGIALNGIRDAIDATVPENFDELSSFAVHRNHTLDGQSSATVKVEGSNKRKRTNAHNCKNCHETVNDVYYSWVENASRIIRKQIENANIAEPSTASKSKDKGKQRAMDENQVNSDATTIAEDEGGSDCPICCNENIPAKDMTQCTDGHRFCKSCVRKHVEAEIGLQRTKLQCMLHIHGCNAVFAESEIKQFLNEKAFQLWSQMKIFEELKSAKIEGLESCPFCPFAYVVYPEDADKPFFCYNSDECGKWSCRACKQLYHEGKTCEEARQSKMTSAHKAEEKLAEALMRRCPKAGCNTVMVKDEGQRSCNKMNCVKCKTIMCYVCRKDITKEGYAHFDHNPAPEVGPGRHRGKAGKSFKKCPLWDDTKERHKEDLNNARKEVGKLAPKVTQAELEDERRREQLFDERYGRNAARIPGEWGFAGMNENLGRVRLLDGDEVAPNHMYFVHQHLPPQQRLGEGVAEALDRRLQEEADRRQAERGNPEDVLLERQRQLRHRNAENLYFRPVGWAGDAVQANILDLEQHGHRFARRIEGIRRDIDEIAGDVGRLNAQLEEMQPNALNAVLNAPIARAIIPQVNPRINALRVRGPLRAQGANLDRADNPYALRPMVQVPEVANGKTAVQVKKEKSGSKPAMKVRKVDHAWQWLERSSTPKESAGTQAQEDKGVGSSKSSASKTNEGAAQAGPSRTPNAPRAAEVIDLTMSSDEEGEHPEDFEVDFDGIIYL